MDNDNNNRPRFSLTAVAAAVVFALVTALGVGWFTTFVPDIFPAQASAESKNVDDLFMILLVIGGLVFFLIQGLLVISVIAFRARPGDDSDGPSYHGNTLLEIVWTIIPALVVVFLSVISFNVWVQNETPKASINMVNGESIDVKVAGSRFAWTHTYETNRLDAAGEPIVINSGPVLHTYIGQNVDLILQAEDVIHAYWIPAMRVKQDLLPGDPMAGGRPTQLRFTPIRVEGASYPTEYPIVCAELCGDGHGRMRGAVVVYEDESQYLDLFYEPAIYAILNPPADPVLRGEVDIQSYICNSCHILDSLGWTGSTGPSLNGIADRAGERVAGQSAEEYLITSVWDPNSYLVPGYDSQMANFGPDEPGANAMTAEQLYSIVAYLCTQGEQTDCDSDNSVSAIPDAIRMVFDIDVDINFGRDGETEETGGA